MYVLFHVGTRLHNSAPNSRRQEQRFQSSASRFHQLYRTETQEVNGRIANLASQSLLSSTKAKNTRTGASVPPPHAFKTLLIIRLILHVIISIPDAKYLCISPSSTAAIYFLCRPHCFFLFLLPFQFNFSLFCPPPTSRHSQSPITFLYTFSAPLSHSITSFSSYLHLPHHLSQSYSPFVHRVSFLEQMTKGNVFYCRRTKFGYGTVVELY